MPRTYEERNMFADDHFPDHWEREDVVFLAEFLQAETKFRLDTSVVDSDYPFRLYRRVEQ